MKKLISLLSVFLVLLFLHGYGQQISPMVELDYIIEEFTLPGGRAGNSVNSIVQGPHGFLWFGSHGGLHRYDGHEFVTYKNVPGDTLAETTSLTFPYVEHLYWDQFNMLWVSTYGGGLYRFDPLTETFKHFAHNPQDSTSISHPRVVSAVEDASGELWFGTENGLNRFDRKSGKFKRYYAEPGNPDSLQANDVRSLYVDKQGTLWAGTGFVFFGISNSGGLSRYNPDTDSFTTYVYDPNDDNTIWTSAVRGILEDSRGNFWVGTNMGLQKMNRSDGTFKRMTYDPGQPYSPGASDRTTPAVYTIHEDKKGGLWIGTIGDSNYPTHLLRYDPDSKKSQVFPMQGAAWQLCEGSDGTIWIAGASVTGKVLKIRPKSKSYNLYTGDFFQEAFNASKLSAQVKHELVIGPINMTIDSANGHFWLQFILGNNRSNLTDGEIVLADYNPVSKAISFHYLAELNPVIDFSVPANAMGITGLIIDKKGTLWGSFPSQNIGIFNYDPVTRITKQYLHDPDDATSITSNNIITLMMDSRGEIWAATFANGLNRLDPATEKITHYHFNEATTDAPIALMEARDGMIWVGGELMMEGGYAFLAVINPANNTIKKLPMQDQGTFRMITALAQSPVTGEVIFTINGNGVGFHDPVNGLFYFWDTSEGFPFHFATSIVYDQDGIYWAADVGSPTFIRSAGRGDNFVFNESTEYGGRWRSNGLLGPNGHIYFLSFNGWFEIDPSAIKPEISTTSSNVQLVELYVMGEKQKPKLNSVLPKPLWLMNEISLPSGSDNFSFRFSDFDFQNTNAQFEYRLYPYETVWRKSGSSPVANYYRIPSGSYTFQVKSIRSSGVIEVQLAELNVVILPPWWKTWWAYGAYGLIFIGGVFMTDRFQRKRLLEKSKAEAKEKELEQAREIEKAYTDLKATQSQLIQSEKMASLGELTAGIAHEIQNPLNFVNNFSEVNKELLMEMNDEITKGNFSDVKEIAKNVIDNEEKIIFHGKRADGIVKGMLQHSRSSSGVKEPNDINALADEYLRLAYHGLRAKDKSFNAIMKTDFDESIGKINIIPQDIGRVILNLITNAFYVVNERLRQACLPDRQAQPDSGYEPTVTVSTKKEGNNILISVKDNGNGIPNSIKEKIFQPFFTTKPTGQGTGLGLSLSYDIVKAHGGELKVETNEGVGSEFIIVLPV